MYMTEKEKAKCTGRWYHFFEGQVYIECLEHGILKPPVLEIEPDSGSYQHPAFTDEKGKFHPATIHIGYGMLQAKTPEELFNMIHHLLGHELQHRFSSTDKDWEAGQKLCFRDACQRISVRVFGKPRRLTKDSDYDAFFKDLAANGVFVNQDMLSYYIHFILNVLEDGRIETIRTRKHPGFGKYRKTFRGAMWREDDFRDEPFFEEDPAELDAMGEFLTILGQIYPLATIGIYQLGFLTVYGGTELHEEAASFIPEISRAILSPTCKGCMDEGREIFSRLLDRLIDICMVKADAETLEKLLQELVEKLLEDFEKMQMSASPRTEEKGDGLPSESVFGKSELVLEVDEETYEKMKDEFDEADGDEPGVKLKLKRKDGEEDEEESEGETADSGKPDSGKSDDGEDSPSADESADNQPEESDDGKSDDGKSTSDAGSESGDEAAGQSGGADSDTSDEDSDAKGTLSGSEASEGGNEQLSGGESEENAGHDNIVDSASECPLSEEELIARLESEMEAASKAASTDFELAEADARLDEKFKKAANKLNPVAPKPVPLEEVDAKYPYDVRFVETTRKYKPTNRLPLELENNGQSLRRTIQTLIKNKRLPDRRFQKSGKLDTRLIADIPMGRLDIYKKKGDPVKSDVAAFLLMDNSGSMGNGPGSTRFACCNAFAIIEEGFKEAMPLKIAAFDASGNNSVQHEVIKEFDEVAPVNLSFNFRDLGRGGWGNKDGYSIRVAAKQLQARSEKDKILIIASDGFPTDYRGGFKEGCADVKAAVQEARKAGLRVIGMYMYHDQDDDDFAVFREMYGPEIIFASLDDIEPALKSILSRYFR